MLAQLVLAKLKINATGTSTTWIAKLKINVTKKTLK